jgi:probable rRNA maturation factor
MIYIDEEVEIPLDFDYKETIERVIAFSIDFVNCPYECEVNVILTDNLNIQVINKEYRGIDAATDVLSFPSVSYEVPADFAVIENQVQDFFNPETGELVLGDIVISVERAIGQALEYGHTPLRELAFLTAHSMLHLFGYDHMEEDQRVEMEKLQNEILDSLKIYR